MISLYPLIKLSLGKGGVGDFYAPFLGLANAFFQTIGYPGLCHFHGGILVHFLRILFRKRARLNLR